MKAMKTMNNAVDVEQMWFLAALQPRQVKVDLKRNQHMDVSRLVATPNCTNSKQKWVFQQTQPQTTYQKPKVSNPWNGKESLEPEILPMYHPIHCWWWSLVRHQKNVPYWWQLMKTKVPTLESLSFRHFFPQMEDDFSDSPRERVWKWHWAYCRCAKAELLILKRQLDTLVIQGPRAEFQNTIYQGQNRHTYTAHIKAQCFRPI